MNKNDRKKRAPKSEERKSPSKTQHKTKTSVKIQPT